MEWCKSRDHFSCQFTNCSVNSIPSSSITSRHPRPISSLTGSSVGGGLPQCRDAVGVFYSPNRRGGSKRKYWQNVNINNCIASPRQLRFADSCSINGCIKSLVSDATTIKFLALYCISIWVRFPTSFYFAGRIFLPSGKLFTNVFWYSKFKFNCFCHIAQ